MLIDMGTFTVDVNMQPNRKFDVYIAHEGSSGSHYTDVTADKIGELVAEEIECLAESYENELSEKPDKEELFNMITILTDKLKGYLDKYSIPYFEDEHLGFCIGELENSDFLEGDYTEIYDNKNPVIHFHNALNNFHVVIDLSRPSDII